MPKQRGVPGWLELIMQVAGRKGTAMKRKRARPASCYLAWKGGKGSCTKSCLPGCDRERIHKVRRRNIPVDETCALFRQKRRCLDIHCNVLRIILRQQLVGNWKWKETFASGSAVKQKLRDHVTEGRSVSR